MTEQELIARLLDHETDLADCAADRIEQLNERLTAATDDAKEAEAYAQELEAKLAKAVETLRETTQMLSQCTFTIIRMKGQYFERHEVVDKAHAVLAELEGK